MDVRRLSYTGPVILPSKKKGPLKSVGDKHQTRSHGKFIAFSSWIYSEGQQKRLKLYRTKQSCWQTLDPPARFIETIHKTGLFDQYSLPSWRVAAFECKSSTGSFQNAQSVAIPVSQPHRLTEFFIIWNTATSLKKRQDWLIFGQIVAFLYFSLHFWCLNSKRSRNRPVLTLVKVSVANSSRHSIYTWHKFSNFQYHLQVILLSRNSRYPPPILSV